MLHLKEGEKIPNSPFVLVFGLVRFIEFLLLLLKSPVKYPALRDSISEVLPTAEWPKTFSLILVSGSEVGISCSM